MSPPLDSGDGAGPGARGAGEGPGGRHGAPLLGDDLRLFTTYVFKLHAGDSQGSLGSGRRDAKPRCPRGPGLTRRCAGAGLSEPQSREGAHVHRRRAAGPGTPALSAAGIIPGFNQRTTYWGLRTPSRLPLDQACPWPTLRPARLGRLPPSAWAGPLKTEHSLSPSFLRMDDVLSL